MTSAPSTFLARTGIEGLDAILEGGLPRRRLYLVSGYPGTGKTTLALQFLLEGIRQNEAGLYITLSETKDELDAVARSHGWKLDDIIVQDLALFETLHERNDQNTFFHTYEVELSETMALVMEHIEKTRPQRVVFDSLSELRLLAGDSLRYRRQILSLKQRLAKNECTVLFLDDRTSDTPSDLQLQSLAHGVVELTKMVADFGGLRRQLEVAKLRGVEYKTGKHDFILKQSGLQVFPRLVAAAHAASFERGLVKSTIREMDELVGGGLDVGTSTLLMGPAGVGKSTLATQYALGMLAVGKPVAIFTFDENIKTLLSRAAGVGLNLDEYVSRGLLAINQIDPAQLSPGEFVHSVRTAVEGQGARMVIIDSLNGYLNAMPNERFLTIHMHELLTYLSQRGCTTLLIVAQHGLVGPMQSPVDVTYLADSVILFRYFEANGRVRRALSVLKKRIGAHEDTIRELQVRKDGISIGKALSDFRGVLTGIPEYVGASAGLLDDD